MFENERTSDKAQRLLIWHTIGVSESKLGERVEAVLEGSGYLTGYRPHIPYVDIKVWIPFDRDPVADPFVEALNQELKDCTVAQDGADLADKVIDGFSAQGVHLTIDDRVTCGLLAKRLGDTSSRRPTSNFSCNVRTEIGGSAGSGANPEHPHSASNAAVKIKLEGKRVM